MLKYRQYDSTDPTDRRTYDVKMDEPSPDEQRDSQNASIGWPIPGFADEQQTLQQKLLLITLFGLDIFPVISKCWFCLSSLNLFTEFRKDEATVSFVVGCPLQQKGQLFLLDVLGFERGSQVREVFSHFSAFLVLDDETGKDPIIFSRNPIISIDWTWNYPCYWSTFHIASKSSTESVSLLLKVKTTPSRSSFITTG